MPAVQVSKRFRFIIGARTSEAQSERRGNDRIAWAGGASVPASRLAEVPAIRDVLNQLVLEGVVGKFSVGLHAGLLEDARAVGADGAHAKGKHAGNFADGFARSD